MRKPTRKMTATELRYEAGWAYLDGRTKRARELNRLADLLDRAARAKAAQLAA